MDFDRYSKEFYLKTSGFMLKDITKSYQLPNYDDLHNMICGQVFDNFSDAVLFDRSQSIDYFEYEKALWSLEKPKT